MFLIEPGISEVMEAAEPLKRMGKRPIPLNKIVTRQMKKMPRAGSKPELLLRSELFRRGMRFRVNYKRAPGRPDIAFTRAKIAVFVDGCFWHACPIHGTLPKNNREWWRSKLEGNRERDARKDLELRAQGWLPLHYWEHDDIEEVADEIEEIWKERRQSTPNPF